MAETSKYTEAKKKGNRKWDAANLDRISVAAPKGRKDAVKAHAEARGESVNGFINRAIDETSRGRERAIAGLRLQGGGKPGAAGQGRPQAGKGVKRKRKLDFEAWRGLARKI